MKIFFFRKTFVGLIISILILLSIPRVSQAMLLDLTVTGTVSDITPSVSSVFNTSQTMYATFTFDANAMPQPSLILTQALYMSAITHLDFQIGSYIGNGLGGNINIENDDPTYNDRLRFIGAGLNSPAIGTHDPVTFGFILEDVTQTALSSLALPTTPPNLVDFNNRQWQLLFSPLPLSGDPVAAVGGRLISLDINPHPVPEPATLGLLCLGLAGLRFSRYKKA